MHYKKVNWKYVLLIPYVIEVNIPANGNIDGYIALLDYDLEIASGYAWDGPSGPAIDTDTFMRGSLVHDALYQLMREGKLSSKYRKRADELLRTICLEDGMNPFRAWYIYHGVRLFSGYAAKERK